MPLEVPEAFVEFSTFLWAEEPGPEFFGLGYGDIALTCAKNIPERESLIAVRDFLSKVLDQCEEDELRRLWISTYPYIMFGGDGVFREFFTVARDVLTEAIETKAYKKWRYGDQPVVRRHNKG